MSELLLIDVLLDEDTDAVIKQFLEDQGHDVERVVEIDELGPGTDDADVLDYAEREDRVIITYDEGFFQRCQEESGPLRLMWLTQQQAFRASEEARIIANVLEILDNRRDVPRVLPIDGRFDY